MTPLVKEVIYSLKGRFGIAVDLIWLISTSTNVETGKVTNLRDKKRIRKAILLPTKESFQFTFDLAYIAASKNFTMGALYEVGERLFIIDRKDIPGIELTPGMYFLRGDKRWDIKDVRAFEEDAAYVVLAKQDVAVQLEDVVEASASTEIDVEITSEGTL